jgi:hypothetical protein
MLIDEFLFAAGQTEGLLTVTERGIECPAPNSVSQNRRRVFEVDLMRKKIARLAVHGTTG